MHAARKAPAVRLLTRRVAHAQTYKKIQEDFNEFVKAHVVEAKEEEAPPENNYPPELTCSICKLIFLDPQDLPCGHFFCHECILDTFQVTAKMACPTCDKPCWKRQLKPKSALAKQCEEYKAANNIE